MNKERVLELADAIEQTIEFRGKYIESQTYYFSNKKVVFDMNNMFCSNDFIICCCIAGFSVTLFDHNCAYHFCNTSQNVNTIIFNKAKELLDLSYDEAKKLFLPDLPRGGDYKRVTTSMAAKVLRHFAETGIIDWWIAY